MAMLTNSGLEPVIWVLLAAITLCWVALTLKAVLQRRSEDRINASSDSLHVHCFPLGQNRDRKCLICGASAAAA